MSNRYPAELLADRLVRAIRQIAVWSFLLVTGISTAVGQSGGPSQDQIVQSFYPAALQQEMDNNPNRWGYFKAWCSAAYNATTIMAAYSNGVKSNISVLQQQSDGSYAVGFSLTGANLSSGHCVANAVDLNGDGVPEVEVSFIGIKGNNDDWFFTWNGTALVSIGPVDTTAGIPTTDAVNSQLVDVLHNGTIQLIVPGDDPPQPPDPAELYSLVNGSYAPAPVLIAFPFILPASVAQPITLAVPFDVPAAMHGPFSLRVVNGDSQGNHRVTATVTVNGTTVNLSPSTEQVNVPVTLQPTNNSISISTNGPQNSQLVVMVQETAPSNVTVSGSSASLTIPETISSGGDVTYSITGLPAGVTASFNPPAVNGDGDSVLNLFLGPNATAGSYSVTITATNTETGQTQTTPVTLQLTGQQVTPLFSVSANTSVLSINAGNSNTITVSETAPQGFADPVNYSVSGLPAGVSATFSATSLTGPGGLSVTFAVSEELEEGTYDITLAGTDGQSGAVQVLPLQLTVKKNSLPQGWNDQDIGTVGIGGSATFASSGVLTIQASGCGAATNCDQSHYAYKTGTGNWSLVARVVSIAGGNGNSAVGIMARDSLNSGAANEALLEIVGGNTVSFAGGSASLWNSGPTISANTPVWLRLTRMGTNFTGFYSLDAVTWVQVGGTLSIPMSNNPAYAGVMASSGDNGLLATATVDGIAMVLWGLPSGWGNQDVGTVGVSGSAQFNSGLMMVQGSGCGVSGSCDEFQYAYATTQGNWSLIAQVKSMQGGNGNSVVGIMMRDSLTADANEALLAITGESSISFSGRSNSSWTPGTPVSASTPLWLQLNRWGNSFTAYYSSDGVTWSQAGGTLTIPMNSNPGLAGIVVSSGDNTATATAYVANLQLNPFAGPPFAVSISPGTLQISTNQIAILPVSVTAGAGFSDTINLSISGLPSGVVSGFGSAAVNGPGTSTLTLSAAGNATPGVYPVTITGADATTGVSQNATLSLNILAAPVPNGSYTLNNGASNLFLADPAGSTTPGTQMVQAGATGGLEQQWQFVFQPGGYYTIQNAASQLYLTDPGSSNTPGVAVRQTAVTNDDSQLWTLTLTGNAYSITNKATGLAIDDPGWSTTGGAGMDLWVATGTANQAWSISGMTSSWPSGNYLLVNGASDLLLADPGSSTTPGTQMVQWSATGGQEQVWYFALQPSGYYTIQNVASQLLLADPGGAGDPGTALQQMAATNDDTELWAVYVTGSGYSVQNKATGLALDDPGYSYSEGTGIDLWSANGGTNQNWSIAGLGQAPIPNGTYTLTNATSELYLADPGASMMPGMQIVQSDATGGAEQQWQFVYQANGYYTIQNVSSGLYLTDPGSSNTAGTALEQMIATNDDSQLWSLVLSGGAYALINKASWLAIDDAGWSTTSGLGNDLWTANGGANQNWWIE